ncbi:hypothetical protein FH608_045910 [Nonomuraea phyllanthi]|uniref:Uncharacterized protein n=1 Tax=Nonomuraea phyllanthi TaxID=2219224 RepID=A0A5C4V6L9_9ACTN|nr:hypothetical protein [Nonomuraea phyllanthi]KAB8186833.1 hypothetical protein FH608_045910 [Nonomuraea phyllanthi]
MTPSKDGLAANPLSENLAQLNNFTDANVKALGQSVAREESVVGPTADAPKTAEPVNAVARAARAERIVASAAAKAQRDAIRDQARRDRERRAEQWAAEREQLRTERKRARKTAAATARTTAYEVWRHRLTSWWHAFVMVGAIVGVNIVAVAGQVTAFQAAPFSWPAAGALGAAAVIESIAIYIGWHAHIALIEGDSVFRLRAASYGIAAGVAALNYHHYAADWSLDDQAVMFGGASLLSPWLWAIHSRHVHRKDLRAKGLIDPRAPKFAALRWILHRAETWRALKWAVRHGEQSPTAAILAIQITETGKPAERLARRASVELDAGREALVRAQAAALAATEAYAAVLERRVSEVSAIAPPAPLEIEPAPDSSADAQEDAAAVSEVSDETPRERPDAQDNKEAEKWIRAAMRKGKTPKQADIAAKFGFSNGWANLRVKAARADLTAEGYRFLPGNRVIPPIEAAASPTAANVSDANTEVSGDQS